MMRRVLAGIALAVLLGGLAQPAVAAEDAVEARQAQQWLRMGELARQLGAYDLAIQVYQRLMDRYPGTRWAKTAASRAAQVTHDAESHALVWDPALAGTEQAAQAQELLRAGDLAYRFGDPIIALIYYDRAQQAAPNSRYSRRAAANARWVRGWNDLGP